MSNDPFLPSFRSLFPPVPFGLLQRLCRYFGFGPTFVKKVIPAKSVQDRPRPTKNLKITWTGLVPLYNVCWPCLVTSFSHLPSGQGKREGSIIQGASALYLVQIITIPASAVDHHGSLPYEEISSHLVAEFGFSSQEDFQPPLWDTFGFFSREIAPAEIWN